MGGAHLYPLVLSWRSKAMAKGLGQRPWPKAMAKGHGQKPWPKATAKGHGQRPLPKATKPAKRTPPRFLCNVTPELFHTFARHCWVAATVSEVNVITFLLVEGSARCEELKGSRYLLQTAIMIGALLVKTCGAIR